MTSRRTARAPRELGERPTRWPVTSSPPSASSSATSASATACAPPRIIGQPTAWAYVARTSPNDGTQRAIEAEHRVGRDAREQRPCRLVVEPAAGEAVGRAQRRQPEAAMRQRMARDVDDRPQHLRRELRRRRGRAARTAAARPGRPPPPRPAAVAVTDRSSTAARPPSSGCATGASGWTSSTPCAARSIDPEERRGDGQRQDRRAHVVAEPGQGQLRVRVPPPVVVGRLVDPDRAPGTGQRDRRGQPVRARPDDDRVERGRCGGLHRGSWVGRSHSHTDAGATTERVVLARSSVTAPTSISWRSRTVNSATVRSWS